MNKPGQHSSTALFRFSVVAKALAMMSAGGSRAGAVRLLSAEEHIAFDGSTKRVYARSIYRWLSAYDASGVHGLEPKAKLNADTSKVLPQNLLDFLRSEKEEDPQASVPELIRRATEGGILKQRSDVSRSTVYRACKRLGLSVARCRHAKDRDSRRFAHPHRMDMVLCDGKHFRAGSTRSKRVALFFIDDASRLVLTAVVGTGETKELFLRGVYECIHRFGLMTTVFVDNGPGFIAKDSLAVFASLGILLIHGERCYKEGHGKIERFNRTIKADLLRGLDGHPDVDPDCGSLELRLRHYIEKIYANRPHESLRGQTPQQRFSLDPRVVPFPAADINLRSKFEIDVERRVSNDHVVSIDGVEYEMPRGYAGRKITLRRRTLEGTVVFDHRGEVIQLHPVNLAANAHARRAKDEKSPLQAEKKPSTPTTAAQAAFSKSFKPIVDEAGGFIGGPSITNDTRDPDQTS